MPIFSPEDIAENRLDLMTDISAIAATVGTLATAGYVAAREVLTGVPTDSFQNLAIEMAYSPLVRQASGVLTALAIAGYTGLAWAWMRRKPSPERTPLDTGQ